MRHHKCGIPKNIDKKIPGSFLFIIPVFVISFNSFLFFSCVRAEPARMEFILGTICSVNLYGLGSESVYNEIFGRLREIENLMSVNIPSSEISRINAAAGIEPVRVSEETFNVIKRAVYFARLSEGAFDPSIGPVVILWGIGSGSERVPASGEIAELLPLVNWRNIELDEEAKTVFLTQCGMSLDLGAIAKGYAADEAAAIVKKALISRALIDLGGNIIITGEKKDASPWRIGVQNPEKQRGTALGYLQITAAPNESKTVVTSGTYERYFENDGIRYHHLFNPPLGYPAQNGLISVTVTADVSMDADALSTAVFVLGFEKGFALIESLDGIEAVFVFEDRSVRTTAGADFTLTDKTYFIKK